MPAPPATPTQLFIGGVYCDGHGSAQDVVLSPATGDVLYHVAKAGREDVDKAVRAARAAFDSTTWGIDGPDGAARGAILRRMAAALKEQAADWAVLESLDNGKPLAEAKADMEACVEVLEYYAGLAEGLGPMEGEVVDTGDADLVGRLAREPVGVVAMVTPWNFPLFQAVAKVAPAVAAGCAMVLKPSPLAPMTTLRLGALAEDAGLPAGVLNIVAGGVDCGRLLVSHSDVDKVSFTGSLRGGREVMQACAAFPRPVALELGGKGALVVFADADVAAAVDWILCGIFLNGGQVCCATSRLLVHEAVADAVVAAVVDAAAKIKLGDPFAEGVNMGPLISTPQAGNVRKYLDIAKACGSCKVVLGATQPQAAGLNSERASGYVDPIIVTDVPADSPCWTEEIFGPFLCVQRFAAEEEAVAAVNASSYGLAHAVFTSDPACARRVARRVRAGTVWVNCTAAAPAPLPFGGVKGSGFGRELGPQGLDEYLQSKAVVEPRAAGHSWNWYA